MRYVDNRESTAQKYDRLDRECNSYIAKFETLERFLERIYADRGSFKQELESKTINLRKKIQIPETEIGVERVKLDYETLRGWLRPAENRKLRDENQRLQAEIAENSYHLPQTKPKRLSDGKSVSAVTKSVQRDRHFVHDGSLLYTVDSNCRTQTDSLRHTLYDSTDELVPTISGSRIRSKLINLTLIPPSASAAPGSRRRMRFTGYIFRLRRQSKEIMKHV